MAQLADIRDKNVCGCDYLPRGEYYCSVHNHPSGSSSSSTANIEATQCLRKACNLLGIPFID
ncbi:MAG: JAB domain-containing protein [Candidatus Saccharimonadales bacterium]